jgi:hypothetical protein
VQMTRRRGTVKVLRYLESRLSIRQEKDVLGVVLSSPKDYPATEDAPSGRLLLTGMSDSL